MSASSARPVASEYPIPSHDSQPRAMATHPDGSIWFVQPSTNALGRIERDGAITEHKVTTPDAGARCIGPHSNGRMYVTLFDAGVIGELIPQ